MTTTPEPLTLHPTPATPTDAGPWTIDLVDAAFEHVPGSQVRRCPACYADREDTYYVDPWDQAVCAACAATCEACTEQPAVVSARVPLTDPSMEDEVELAARQGREPKGRIEHVCLGCLERFWAPGETLLRPLAKTAGAVGAGRRVA